MDYLLDTNAFSDLMREHPKVAARAAKITVTDRIVICPIVRGEVLYGIQRLPVGKKQKDLESRAVKLFASMAFESLPLISGDLYANVKIAREKQGLALDENDLWITATTLALQAALVSRDGDFTRIEGLRVEDWSA